ncbi:Lrp/AsnC ligand binding domain-containing protein [Burkholderia cepacia]|uniref:Lrp/AsnC ligand binding domain-containing protein n=1 Tax=Burkholderia cepacia TaxID=292 RepID=UPI002AB74514|nr:Lrp/AsnC ligand binding domain-containing protein [Burkholderia cepacia]
MSAFCVAGSVDFVLLVTASNVEEYQEFTRRIAYDNADVRRIETMVILDRFKAGFTLPIPFEPIDRQQSTVSAQRPVLSALKTSRAA